MRHLLALMLALSAAPAAAQIIFDPTTLNSCWAETRSADCAGQASGQCMESTAEGGTTVGMIECLRAELFWWDELIEIQLEQLRQADTALDAAPPELAVPDRPSAVAALDRMAKLWADWADARCDYEVIPHLGGTIRGPIAVGCRLDLAAAQADYLAGMLADARER